MAASSDLEIIQCPIGKWYFKRMSLLGLLLIGFGCWFLYDAVIGYPRGAVKAVIHEAFKAGSGTTWEAYSSSAESKFSQVELDAEQLETVKAAFDEGGKKATWADFARKRKIDTGEPAASSENRALFDAFTAGGADGADWKDYAVANGLPERPAEMEQRDDKIDAIYNAFEDAGKPREWALYAAENDLPSKEPHFHGKGDILEQYVIGALCGAAGLFVLVLMVLNRDRSVSADAEAYYPKPSVKVPFADVYKIDTRKWRRKGLAYAYYRSDSSEENKAVLDDLKFVGSQAILDRMLVNFEGELFEEVIDDDDEAGEGSEGEAGKVENAAEKDV